MAWLLDTNIPSEIRRLKPEPKVLAFISGRPLDDLFISAVTLAELRFGIELLRGSNRRDELKDWLTHTIRPMFDERVLPVTEDIMFRWRVLVERGRKAGHTYSQPDLIIAATALEHGLTMVTRDRGDFEKARVTVLNPWLSS
ncbi:MAG TPA: type II toxin-antitoxin system VapC family toxin [Bryobacteraceae bacterium]|nr:type II toxin-antitoxin system VapC family toxin [Bryobacteraceae bacterium]